jgi:hypothetical protein
VSITRGVDEGGALALGQWNRNTVRLRALTGRGVVTDEEYLVKSSMSLPAHGPHAFTTVPALMLLSTPFDDLYFILSIVSVLLDDDLVSSAAYT